MVGLTIPKSALGDLPALPFSNTGSVQDFRTKMSEAERHASEASTKALQAGEREATLRKQKSAEYSPVMEKMGQRIEEEQAKTVEPLEALPELKQTQISPEQTKEAFTTFLTFAMLGGALTRQPMLAAMNNMTAAMKGWQEGDTARVKSELDSFDRNFKIAQAKRSGQIEERKAALEKYKGDIAGLELAEKQIALKFEDQIAAELARKGDFNALAKHYDTLAKNYETAIHHADQVDAQNRRIAETERKDQQRHQEMMAKLTAGGDKSGAAVKANSKEGKLAVDEGFKPGTPEFVARVKEIEASKGGAKIGSRERAAANNLVSAANEAAVNIANLAELSQGSPLFANKLANVDDKGSLLGGVSQFAARRMSTEDQQMYVKIVDALVGSLAAIQSGTGYASDRTKGKIDQLKSVITAKEGATNAVGYQALAEANQIYIRGLESLMTNAALNPEQRALLKRNIREAAEAIPFTVKDVIGYRRSDKVQTMPEWLEEHGRKGSAYENILKEAKDEPLFAVPQPGEQIHIDKNGVKAVLRNGNYVVIKGQ